MNGHINKLTTAGLASLAPIALMGAVAFLISCYGTYLSAGMQSEAVEGKSFVLAASLLVTTFAHFAPNFALGMPVTIRWGVMAAWLAMAAAVVLGHARYLMFVQEEQGQKRTAMVQTTPAGFGPKRPLSEILLDKAQIERKVFILAGTSCAESCAARNRRSADLVRRLEALAAEADEFRSWTSAEQEAKAKQQRAIHEPSWHVLSEWTGAAPSSLEFAGSLIFAIGVELIGCLSWLMLRAKWVAMNGGRIREFQDALPPKPVLADEATLPLTELEPPEVITPAEPVPTGSTSRPHKAARKAEGSRRSFEELRQLAKAAFEQGQIKLTGAAIQRYLKCQKAKSLDIAKSLK